MRISIHQPDFIPYMGYFYKISQSDKFVFLDDCQFSNDNMHHWNRIKTPNGECRLKIPVEQHLGDTILQVRTKDELKWKQKHLKTIEMNYKKAPYFNTIYSQFAEILLKDYSNIADLNISINMWIINAFGFNTEIYRSSELSIETVREERVIDICINLQGDTYISGNGARAYQVDADFLSRGINLKYTDFKGVDYPQLWGEFVPNMSILDYLFNCGFDWEQAADRIHAF